MSPLRAATAVVSLTAIATTAWAQDAVMAQQGRLLDAAGGAFNGIYTLTFRLYDAPDPAASALWSETEAVNIGDGYYAVVLGDGTPFPAGLFSGAPRWLGVQIGTDPELVPRAVVGSVPGALHATTADNVTGAITPTAVSIGNTPVIDTAGRWVGESPPVQTAGSWITGDGTNGTPLTVDISAHTADASAHHTRYTNVEATGALVGRAVVWNRCAWVSDACEVDGGALVYLDRMANLDCPANQVLRDFNVSNCSGGLYKMNFLCCSMMVQ